MVNGSAVTVGLYDYSATGDILFAWEEVGSGQPYWWGASLGARWLPAAGGYVAPQGSVYVPQLAVPQKAVLHGVDYVPMSGGASHQLQYFEEEESLDEEGFFDAQVGVGIDANGRQLPRMGAGRDRGLRGLAQAQIASEFVADLHPASALKAAYGIDNSGRKMSDCDRILEGASVFPLAGAVRRGGKLVEAGSAVVSKLTKSQATAVRNQARRLFQATYGKLPLGYQVHHRYPLEYAHIVPGHPNRLENLTAVSEPVHTEISKGWAAFRNRHRDSPPSLDEIIGQVNRIDEKFGQFYFKEP